MMNFTTAKQADSTHVIDDGAMIYWVAAPGNTNDEVAEAFRHAYDGTLGEFDVTDLKADERDDYEG